MLPISGTKPIAASGMAKTSAGSAMRCRACTDRPAPPPMVTPCISARKGLGQVAILGVETIFGAQEGKARIGPVRHPGADIAAGAEGARALAPRSHHPDVHRPRPRRRWRPARLTDHAGVEGVERRRALQRQQTQNTLFFSRSMRIANASWQPSAAIGDGAPAESARKKQCRSAGVNAYPNSTRMRAASPRYRLDPPSGRRACALAPRRPDLAGLHHRG